MQNDIFKQSYFPNILGHTYPPTSISENVLTTASYSSGTSSVNVGPANIFSWAHTVPTYMPWAPKHPDCLSPSGVGTLATNTASTSSNKTSVVRFTAPQPCTSQTASDWELYNLGNPCNGSSHSSNQHLKRRSDDFEEWRPTKQYISEEKMAAKLGKLSINEDTIPLESSSIPAIPSTSRDPMGFDYESDSNESFEERLKPKGSIDFSEELKRLLQPDSLIKSLVKEVKKPNMALVLWEPPGSGIRNKIWQNTPTESTTSSSSTTTTLSNSDSIFAPLRGRNLGADVGMVFAQSLNNNNNTTIPNLNAVNNDRMCSNLSTGVTGFAAPSVNEIDDEMELEL